MKIFLVLSLLGLASVVRAEPKPASKAEASAGVPMDPKVKQIVDAMQAFYEKNLDFEAHFDQHYAYVSSHRTMNSSGKVVFRKPREVKKGELLAPAMRWDYEQPEPKSIIVTGGFVYMYDPGAQTLTKAALNMEKLSASVTFLWGQGKLADEFFITRDPKAANTLVLQPKKADPRFDHIVMVVDPKSFQVTGTTVVDPDGSQNQMLFSQVKTDQKVPNERFVPDVPPGTQMVDMTQAPAAPGK